MVHAKNFALAQCGERLSGDWLGAYRYPALRRSRGAEKEKVGASQEVWQTVYKATYCPVNAHGGAIVCSRENASRAVSYPAGQGVVSGRDGGACGMG